MGSKLHLFLANKESECINSQLSSEWLPLDSASQFGKYHCLQHLSGLFSTIHISAVER